MAQQSPFCLCSSVQVLQQLQFVKCHLRMIVLVIIKGKDSDIVCWDKRKQKLQEAKTQNQARGYIFNTSVKNLMSPLTESQDQ